MGYYLDGTEAVRAAQATKQRQKKEARRQQQAAQQQQQAGASDSEDEGNMRPMPSTGGGPGGGKGGSGGGGAANGGGGLSQAELIRRAFAGDDVAAEFAASKAEEVEGELPKVRKLLLLFACCCRYSCLRLHGLLVKLPWGWLPGLER